MQYFAGVDLVPKHVVACDNMPVMTYTYLQGTALLIPIVHCPLPWSIAQMVWSNRYGGVQIALMVYELGDGQYQKGHSWMRINWRTSLLALLVAHLSNLLQSVWRFTLILQTYT